MDSKSPHSPTIHDAETIPSASTTQFDAYAPVEPPNLWKVFKSQVGTKEGWWGEFDWKTMCLPSIFMKEKTNTPFWGLNSRLPLGLALVMGFQHSLAMVNAKKKKIFFYKLNFNFFFLIFDRSVVLLHLF
jgi:NCS2 family nucleobase:cation symporter-2